MRGIRSGRPNASGRARRVIDACFGEHVLLEDCVAAAKVYLAMALDLCNRKPQRRDVGCVQRHGDSL